MLSQKPLIIAFVGMPGSGKSEATKYLGRKEIPSVRFGEFTDKSLKEQALAATPENEQIFREKVRQEQGMDVFAKAAAPRIEELFKSHQVVVIDGLYSWEEYVYTKERYPFLTLIHIYTEPKVRYERLSKRTIRPFSQEEVKARDVAEITKLNKAGPIAIADHMIENNGSVEELYGRIDQLLQRLEVGNNEE